MKRARFWIYFSTFIVIGLAVISTCIAIVRENDASSITAISGIWVAAATLILALITAASIEESHQQAKSNQRSLVRPLLVPTTSANKAYFPDQGPFDISIHNVGYGVAQNIWGLLMPNVFETKSIPPQYSVRYSLPLAAGENKLLTFSQGGTIFIHEDKIQGIQFGVPVELAPELVMPDPKIRRERVIARMALTYSDIFGEYHASIYDYTFQEQWISVGNFYAIPQDLGMMDKEKGSDSKK